MRTFLRLLIASAALILSQCSMPYADAQVSAILATRNTNNPIYSTAAEAVFANLANETPYEKKWIADFVDRQVANGNWANVLEFQCRAMQTEADALKGWKGVFNGTNLGSATHTPGYGFVYNGTSTYISTGFIPSTHGGSLYVQNDAGVGVFIKQVTTPAQTGYVFGAWDAAARRLTLMQNNGASVDYRLNGATATAYATDTRIYRGMYTIRRTASNAVAIAVNGNQLATAAQTSNALTNQPVYEGALNTSGSVTAGSYLGVDIGAFFVFKGTTAANANLSAFYSDLVVLMYHLQGETYPAWLTVIPFINGQSNAQGDCTETPSTSELQNPLTNCYMYTGSWPELAYGVNNGGDTGPGANFGCELTLAKALRDHYGKDVRMFKHARGGAPVHIQIGTPGYNATEVNGGDYFSSMLNYFDGGYAKIHPLDVCPMFVWVLVHGEAERQSVGNITDWLGNWQGVENKLRVSGPSFSYYIIAKVNSGLTFDTSSGNVTLLRQKPDDFRSRDPRRRKVYDMNNNGALNALNYPHYTGPRYELMGVNIFDIFRYEILVHDQ